MCSCDGRMKPRPVGHRVLGRDGSVAFFILVRVCWPSLPALPLSFAVWFALSKNFLFYVFVLTRVAATAVSE